MNEIEIKVLETTEKDFKDKLLAIGATKVGEQILEATIYDTEEKELRQTGHFLRLRSNGTEHILTHKKRISDIGAKIKKETEVTVDNIENMQIILKELGYKEQRHIKKKRVTYKTDDAHFEFDTHLDECSYIPEFMEIEAHSVEDIHKYCELLGIPEEKRLAWTFTDLKKYYGKKKEN